MTPKSYIPILIISYPDPWDSRNLLQQKMYNMDDTNWFWWTGSMVPSPTSPKLLQQVLPKWMIFDRYVYHKSTNKSFGAIRSIQQEDAYFEFCVDFIAMTNVNICSA